MKKVRAFMKFNKKFAKKRMVRFVKTILPILIAVSILYILQYLT
ncbi:MAG: hypothetical protein ACQEWV_11080 [Bacillota bacterium]